MLSLIHEKVKIVCDNSKYVKIDYEKAKELTKSYTETSFWLSNNPFGILNFKVEEILEILLALHTVGFSYWGNPKWEINTEIGKLDGSYAMMYLLINRYKECGNFLMSYEEFKNMLKGNVEIPLLKERYNMLKIMNEYLSKKSFYKEISNITIDNELFDYLLKNFDYLKDTREYNNNVIYFYKRAQLLTSDILHIRKLFENTNVDYSHLVGCADYKIPQVLNSLGILKYENGLQETVNNLKHIPMNSLEELEIRASTLEVIRYMKEQIKDCTYIDVNDFLWLYSQNKDKMIHPYHRTRTTDY